MYLLWGKGGLLWFTGVVGVEHWSFLIILLLLVKRQSFSCAFNLLFHILLYFVCYHVFSCVDQQKGTSYEINSTSIFICIVSVWTNTNFLISSVRKQHFLFTQIWPKYFSFVCTNSILLTWGHELFAFSFFTPLTSVKRDRFSETFEYQGWATADKASQNHVK